MAGSRYNCRMAAILARNSIVLGDLDAYCLICSKMLPEGKCAIIHIQGSNHQTCADSGRERQYLVKFRDDFIHKINSLYFCELCNDVIPTITSVNIHVTQESHLQCKSRKFERLGTSILFQDDILITDSAWNGHIEDSCVICDVEFTDYELHKSKPRHILGVIQSTVTIDGENNLYRKLTDGYHCLTCNTLLSSNLLKKHLHSPEHFNAIVRHEATQADDNTKTDESDKNYDIEAEGTGASGICAGVAERISTVCVGVTNWTSSSGTDTKTETRKQDEQPSNTDGNTRTDESDKNDDKDAEGNGAGGVCAVVAKGGVTKRTSISGTDTNTGQQDKPPITDGNTKDFTTVGDTNKSFTSKSKSQIETVANDKQSSNTDRNTKKPTSVENTNELSASKSKSKVEIVPNDQQSSNTIGNIKNPARVRKTKKLSPSKTSMVKDTNKPSPSKLAKVKATNKSSPSKLAVVGNINKPSPSKPALVNDTNKPSPAKPAPVKDANKASLTMHAVVKDTIKPSPLKLTVVKDTNEPSSSKLAPVGNINKPSPSKPAQVNDTNKPSPAKPAPVKDANKASLTMHAVVKNINKPSPLKLTVVKDTNEPSLSKRAPINNTNKPSPSKPVMVKETNEPSPAKPAPAEDTIEPSPSKPAPIEDHGSPTSNLMSEVETSSKDKKSSNTKRNAKTRTPVKEKNEPSTSKQKSKIESLVKQYKGLSVEPDGTVNCSLCNIKVLPATETAVEEHVNDQIHKENLPSITDAKDPRIKKKLTKDFVADEDILEDGDGTKHVVINSKICIRLINFLGFMDCKDKFFCHFCDIDVKTSDEDVMAHLSTPTHSQLFENAYVVTTLKGDFIRQINGDFFHCGICGITESEYDEMLDHVATTLHVQAKRRCENKLHYFIFRELFSYY